MCKHSKYICGDLTSDKCGVRKNKEKQGAILSFCLLGARQKEKGHNFHVGDEFFGWIQIIALTVILLCVRVDLKVVFCFICFYETFRSSFY